MRKMKSVSMPFSILACVAALAMTSCGGEAELDGPAGSLSGAAVPTVISSQGFTAFLATLAPQQAGAIQAPGLGGVVQMNEVGGLAVDPYAPCTTTEGSNTDGADGDSIPLNYIVRFNCDSVSDQAALRSMTGTYTVNDKDDTKYGIQGGFKFSYDINQNGQYYVGRKYDSGWSGTWEATPTASTITLANDYTLRYGENLESPDLARSVSARSKFTTVYKPADMNQPFQAGAMNLSGFYRMSGVLTPDGQTSPRYEVDVSFEISSSGLEYGNCGLKEGSFTMTDGAGNRLVYTYQNCVLTKQFNGQNVP